MSTFAMKTHDEIRREGLETLRERLGRAGMVRFMQQFATGEGDYASERREWVDGMSMEDLKRAAGMQDSSEP